MIRLARELDLKVVVEGVESTAQLALLADWGCDLYQGFLGAGALTHEELMRFVARARTPKPPRPFVEALDQGRRAPHASSRRRWA